MLNSSGYFNCLFKTQTVVRKGKNVTNKDSFKANKTLFVVNKILIATNKVLLVANMITFRVNKTLNGLRRDCFSVIDWMEGRQYARKWAF